MDAQSPTRSKTPVLGFDRALLNDTRAQPFVLCTHDIEDAPACARRRNSHRTLCNVMTVGRLSVGGGRVRLGGCVPAHTAQTQCGVCA